MDNKLITGIIGVVVVVALLGSALVPVIDGLTEGEKTTNEGAGWIRMDYTASPTATYQIAADNISSEEGLLVYDNNNVSQIGDVDTIIYASSNLTCWMQDGILRILGQNDNGVFYTDAEESFIVKRLASGVELVVDGGEDHPFYFSAPAWAYLPKSGGNFGFFDAGTPVDMKDYPVAAVGGGFAGAYGFNDLQSYGLGLHLQTDLDEEGKLIGGTWVKAAPEELNTMEFDPSTITIQPLDPSIIDLDPIDLGGGAQLMSVPTPTYTDGDWGYDLTTVDGVTKAIIVSYSGAGGGVITVPTTIGGYDVHQFGKGGTNNVFDTTLTATDLIISNGIKVLGQYCCKGCSGFTGSLVIPDSVTTIGSSAFSKCSGFTGSLVIPNSITFIDQMVFMGCSGFTGSLVIPDSVTTIGSNAFSQCSGFTGSLVIPDSVTTIGLGAFMMCYGFKDTLVIPSTVTTLGSAAFQYDEFTKVIIVSDATPASSSTFSMTTVTEVLDASSTIDYSSDRYGLTETAEVSDSIGDALGYVSFVEIGTDAELSGGAAALLIAVPVVVIAGLLVAFVGYSIVKRY